MKFTGNEPIYIQIKNYIKTLIDAGVFKTDDAIPSVRDFALSNGVNPNTVARAYEILVNEDILLSIPKKGYFVKGKTVEKRNDVSEMLNLLKNKGYTEEDILSELNKVKGDKK